jgi:hypothetical protein
LRLAGRGGEELLHACERGAVLDFHVLASVVPIPGSASMTIGPAHDRSAARRHILR